ncbi:hypothetical protein [Bradyrhizobium sp. 15]|uniref:ORC-CDC6 family AAA ATPase n=1 Tax=Bradyrhizobium sp. 15 TaxID=2782633 RepID=UPI001FFB6028|nr:hypothetical protein [Bradyrhizobium sp. 15]MCK1437063.1 zinc ribbon domain-containing protein [Bradyrhizobium sp. 15]
MSQNAETADPDDSDSGFEERADQVSEEVLRTDTVTGDWFDIIYKSLLSRGTVLVVGPRGCGKTHIMRYAWLKCCDTKHLPLAVYVSFNRYLRLEPLLKTRNDALSLFQIWVLSRILLAADDTAKRVDNGAPKAPIAVELGQEAKGAQASSKSIPGSDVFAHFGIARVQVEALIRRLEKAGVLSEAEELSSNAISIEGVVQALTMLFKALGRTRLVIFLDDAALVFAQEFMTEFLDVVRVIKQQNISPKCSVYPGSTEYGPRFHADHEARFIPAWLPVDHSSYRDIMGAIGARRYAEGGRLGSDVSGLLMYAAFGVPRAYLTMLREMVNENASGPAATQQALNKVIQQHRDSRLREFRSLKLKMPKFSSVIDAGENLFQKVVEIMKERNDALADKAEKQILFGITKEEMTAIPRRMFKLLVEAGLLFELPEVSHGQGRTYHRFTPHLAALIAARAFAGSSRGNSPAQMLSFIERKPTKHPIRQALASLLPSIKAVQFDLPPCQACTTPRISDEQKFCHHCGTRLADDSTFTRLMKLPITEVANLSTWARSQIDANGIKTIEELLAFEDPGTELRKIHRVGPRRATLYLLGVESYIDEFMS